MDVSDDESELFKGIKRLVWGLENKYEYLTSPSWFTAIIFDEKIN